MSVLNPTPAEAEYWTGLVEKGLPPSALTERLALSNLEMALRQQMEMSSTLAKEVVRMRTELADQRDYRSAVINACIPKGYALVDEALLPIPTRSPDPVGTPVPLRLVPEGA